MKLNPGNLQAFCNKLVFAYFQKNTTEVHSIKEALKKVVPILTEQQVKLGATFAIIGEYEPAYFWLRRLQKQGYEGDSSFYYWLSYASYFTGREQLSHTLWEKVIAINPEKKGLEPWSDEHPTANGFEEHVPSILKKLESDHAEERMFGLFLISISDKKEDILSTTDLTKNNKFSRLENQYVSMINTGKNIENSPLTVAHETAKVLYKRYQPIGTLEAGLFLLWFTVFVEMTSKKFP